MISQSGDVPVAVDMTPEQVSIGQRSLRTIQIESSSADAISTTASWSANTVKHVSLKPAWSWKSPLVWFNNALELVFGVRIQRIIAPAEPLCHRYENEEHHRSYGGPWCRGRDHLNSLIREGLDPDDYVLDLGCGSMRVGIWLAQYLNPGRYFGLDSHYASLQAAAHYEIPLNGLTEKQPRLLHSTQFEIDRFGQKFDVVVAVAVLCHLTPAQQVTALTAIVRNASDTLRLFVYQPFDIDVDTVAKIGLQLDRVVEHTDELFGTSSTRWYVYRLN